MRIKKILSRNRRDFIAIYICEHCGHEDTLSGYDDRHFHDNVIPAMECSKCGKTSPGDYIPLATKYPEGAVI